jgi:hypothetical protein
LQQWRIDSMSHDKKGQQIFTVLYSRHYSEARFPQCPSG